MGVHAVDAQDDEAMVGRVGAGGEEEGEGHAQAAGFCGTKPICGKRLCFVGVMRGIWGDGVFGIVQSCAR
jgi:hypothetical protein